MPQAIKIQSKFKSACNTCKGKVDQGEWVFWTPGVKGVLHTECPDPSVKVKPIKVEPQFKLRDDGPIQGFESLFKHQREVVYAALDGHTRLYLGFEMGLGKAQSLNSKVLTPSGYVRMGDISVGDEVLTPQGQPVKVLGVFPQGVEDVYEVTLTDGSKTIASGEHLWEVEEWVNGREVRTSIRTTKEILDRGLTYANGSCRYKMPEVYIDTPDITLPIDPYALGALIGDGSIAPGNSRGVSITSNDDEVFTNVIRALAPLGVKYGYSHGMSKNIVADGRSNLLNHHLRLLGLWGSTSHSKFIPNVYKFAGANQRIELIRGLMDTDGHIARSGNAMEFVSVSERLANDVADVLRSLNCYAKVTKKPTRWAHHDENKTGWAYRVTFNSPFNPFKLSRKASVWRPERQRQRRIKSIIPAGREETQCILIDDPRHLYVTDNYIPTHNTLTSLAAAEVTEQFPLIIVCPAIAKINWQREVKKWIGREAQVVSGRTPYEITEEIVIINYDILDAWTDTLIDLDAKGIIFDEAQYIKNPDSIRSKAAKAVGRTIPGMRFMLSGTPTPNSVYDLVMPLDILGVMGHFVNKTTFIKRYCPAIQTKYGISHSTSRNLSELHRNLKNSCFIRRTKDECLDLPPKIRVDIPIETAVVDDEEFYAPLLAQMRKGTMAEALRVISDNLKPADINAHIATARAEAGREKINAIVELANSIEEPLVIMVHHKEVQNAVKKGIKGKKVTMLVGGMTETKRQEAIDSFQNGESDVILCSITAAGTGINLQRGTQMIMGELPLTHALQDQAESRCHRNGAKNALTVHRLIALGTFDEQMLKILNKKESVSAAVEDGVSIKTTGPADIIAHKLLELYSLSI